MRVCCICDQVYYLVALYIHIGAKPIIVRKIIRNGQPDETNETKKDATKLPETKTQKNESVEMETMDRKEKPKLKPSIKPKVLHHLHQNIYVFRYFIYYIFVE